MRSSIHPAFATTALVTTLVLGALAVGPAASAESRPTPPPPPGITFPSGPIDLGTILAPDAPPIDEAPTAGADATAPAATCPAAPYGVNYYAPGSGKTVALTFDDGPGPSTAAIRSILNNAHVPATFFNLGANMATRPNDVRAEAADGFALGNHTWDHAQLTKLTAAQQANEMDSMINEQRQLVGTAPCVFRPPYGSYNTTTLQLAQARRMAVWLWSVDTEDWKADGSASQYWIDRIVSRAIAGGSQQHPVILFHNQPTGNPATVKALPQVIDYYRSHGYTFVALGPSQSHNAAFLPGVVRGDQWFQRYSQTSGPGQAAFTYGVPGASYVTGDWDANGTMTPGYVKDRFWYLRNANSAGRPDMSFAFGLSTDKPIVGDWDGNGSYTPGVIRGNTWYLRNSNSPGGANLTFTYGNPGDTFVVGDWDGNGTMTPGYVHNRVWYLRNSNSAGPPNIVFSYGLATDRPIAGDWDGNGTFTPGVIRGNLWLLRNSASGGAADKSFGFGAPTDFGVTGAWNG